MLTGLNAGQKRLRVSALQVADGKGRAISFGDGLVGYVLGRSAMRWTSQGIPREFQANTPLTISLKGDNGPVKATALVERLD